MSTDSFDAQVFRSRQKRLIDFMQQSSIDWSLITQHENVQYLTGARFAWTFSPLVAISAAGHVVLVGPEKRVPEFHAADEVHTYEARWHSTMRNDQAEAASSVLAEAMAMELAKPQANRRLGLEFSSVPAHFPWEGTRIDVEPRLYELRRCKDAYELSMLTKAIDATELMYERAREMICPGVNELDVFNELQSVAVREFGEMMTGTGNDYQCASRGGAPRNRKAQAGELYILDLGPAYRGYFADNARTVAVSDPTPAQLETWKYVVEVFDIVEQGVKPGVSAREVFDKAQAFLDKCPHGVFNHHLGHGIGLFPHEAPHLNPKWNDTFQVGDVFTAEPGVYSAELNAGMRIENDYLVTETGIKRLTNFPLELML